VSGCGQSASDQVRAKVQQLARAAASRNYAEICQQVLAPSLVAHLVSNGIPCQDGIQVALSTVHNPVITVGRITVRGNTASAIILSTAQGQQASLSALVLKRTPQGWRIVSLNSPLAAAAGGVGGAAGGGTGTGTAGP